jgi:hypothetical protein
VLSVSRATISVSTPAGLHKVGTADKSDMSEANLLQMTKIRLRSPVSSGMVGSCAEDSVWLCAGLDDLRGGRGYEGAADFDIPGE